MDSSHTLESLEETMKLLGRLGVCSLQLSILEDWWSIPATYGYWVDKASLRPPVVPMLPRGQENPWGAAGTQET